jgi:SOS-response transcriptional repressor LexA
MPISRQQALLVCINDHLNQTGRPPSFDTMKYTMRSGSMSGVRQAVSVLEQRWSDRGLSVDLRSGGVRSR